MNTYKELWNKYIEALIRAIDEITNIDDFLLASRKSLKRLWRLKIFFAKKVHVYASTKSEFL